MSGQAGRSGPPGNAHRATHGTYGRLAAMKGARWDRRRREYKALARRERELCKALGPQATPQRRALAHEIAVIETVLLPPLDQHLSGVQIVSARGRTAPALALRLKLSTRLQELLTALGLDKVQRRVVPAWQRRPPRRKAEKETTEAQGGGAAVATPEAGKK